VGHQPSWLYRLQTVRLSDLVHRLDLLNVHLLAAAAFAKLYMW